MDVDFMNSSPQNHIEMMELMMMQLKPSQLFSKPYQEMSSAESSDVEFSGGSATSIHNPYNFNTNIGNPNQETLIFTNIGHNHDDHQKMNSMEAMREMIFRIAMMQPVQIEPESVKPTKRKNVKISRDPQSVAARHRRERISEKIRTLQRLVPGGTKMDTASMLDEAVHYVKFLKKQLQSLENQASNGGGGGDNRTMLPSGFPTTMSLTSSSATNYSGMVKARQPAAHMVGSMHMLS